MMTRAIGWAAVVLAVVGAPAVAAPVSGGASGGGAEQGGSGAPGSGTGVPGAIVNNTTKSGIGTSTTPSAPRRKPHRRHHAK